MKGVKFQIRDAEMVYVTAPSCYPQIANVEENAGLQTVIHDGKFFLRKSLTLSHFHRYRATQIGSRKSEHGENPWRSRRCNREHRPQFTKATVRDHSDGKAAARG